VKEDRFEELLGPYVLGEPTDAEERELERHLEECFACRNDIDEVRRSHDVLRSAVAGSPPELKDWMLARARSEGRRETAARWRFWLLATAALLVVAVLGVGVLRAVTEPSDGLALTATRSVAPQVGGELRGERVGDNLKVEVEAWGLPEPREGRYYKMWYAREGGGRISCGTFSAAPDGRATVSMSAPVSAAAYPEIGITQEPDNGDPASSGKVVLKGSLRDLGSG